MSEQPKNLEIPTINDYRYLRVNIGQINSEEISNHFNTIFEQLNTENFEIEEINIHSYPDGIDEKTYLAVYGIDLTRDNDTIYSWLENLSKEHGVTVVVHGGIPNASSQHDYTRASHVRELDQNLGISHTLQTTLVDGWLIPSARATVESAHCETPAKNRSNLTWYNDQEASNHLQNYWNREESFYGELGDFVTEYDFMNKSHFDGAIFEYTEEGIYSTASGTDKGNVTLKDMTLVTKLEQETSTEEFVGERVTSSDSEQKRALEILVEKGIIKPGEKWVHLHTPNNLIRLGIELSEYCTENDHEYGIMSNGDQLAEELEKVFLQSEQIGNGKPYKFAVIKDHGLVIITKSVNGLQEMVNEHPELVKRQ